MSPTREVSSRSRFFAFVSLLALFAACSAGAQKPAVKAVMADEDQRAETLEATLQVTDEHPSYVDELFRRTLKHPPTFERFLQNHSRALEQDPIARVTAKHLAAHPPGLRQIMIATLDEVSDDPAAMRAVADAMLERPEVSAMIIAQHDEAQHALVTALVRQVQKNARARATFVRAMQDNAEPLAQIALDNPELVASLARALASLQTKRTRDRLERALE